MRQITSSMKNLKIGILIADIDEYVIISRWLEKNGAVRKDYYSCMGHYFKTEDGNEICTVVSGCGTVNAAVGTLYLVNCGCDVIFNTGYSGGIKGVHPGQAVVGERFIEHDFDLTVLGYKTFEKPGQEYVYFADNALADAALAAFPKSEKCIMLSGNRFVSSDSDCEKFGSMFDTGVSCDMETAAIAYVCCLTGKRFLSVRLISDGAGDDSKNEYRSSLWSAGTEKFVNIIEIALKVIINNENRG